MSKEREFFIAADYGTLEEFNALLVQVDMNCRDKIGQTALHVVATYGNLLKIASLLKAGADPIAQDDDGCTPLMAAVSHMISENRAFSDYYKVIALLVKAGDNAEGLNDLYSEYDDNSKESLKAIKVLNKVVAFIHLVSEGTDEDAAKVIAENQAMATTIGGDTACVDKTSQQGEKRQRSDDNNGREDESSNKEAKQSHTTNHAANNGANQHGDSIASDEDNDSNVSRQTNHDPILETTPSLFLEFVLKNFYAWLNELPKWLQSHMLSLAPVIAMIESAKQMALIYDIKNIAQDFAARCSNAKSNDTTVTEDEIQEKAKINSLNSENLVDMTMIFSGSQVNGLIMPMMNINLFDGQSAFNDLVINFNGLNGIE